MASLFRRLSDAALKFSGKQSAVAPKPKTTTDQDRAKILGKGTAREAADQIIKRKKQQEDLLKELD
jgi:hypothetical protein